MALLIHESAMRMAPERIAKLTVPWRMVTRGSPVRREDTLVVGWDDLEKAAASITDETRHTIQVLLPEGHRGRVHTLNRNVSISEANGCVVLRSLRKRVYDNGSRLWFTMPNTWPGRTWFRLSEVRHWQYGRYSNLLDESFVRPTDVMPYLRQTWSQIMGTQHMGNGRFQRKYAMDNNGNPKVTLRQCFELLPYDASVMATIAGFPFEMVPRSYLLWLVTDGRVQTRRNLVDIETVIETALEQLWEKDGRPKPNSLRDSILYYLDSTKLARCVRPGVVRYEEDENYEGDFSTDPECTRQIRKQSVTMDFQKQDLESRDFCTFGYWNVDTFVACGTSSHVRFENHGTPVWLEREGQSDSDPMPAHLQNGLSEFERQEKWQPVEKINLGWRPLRDRRGMLVTPYTLEQAYERLFANHQRLESWNLHMDWLCREWTKDRSERDMQALEEEWTEHRFLLEQISLEYKAIFKGWWQVLPREWGMKAALDKARERMPSKAVEVYEETREETDRIVEEFMLSQAPKVAREQHLRKVRDECPALGWESMEILRVPKGATVNLKHAILYAKTQNPQPRKRRSALPCYA